MERANAIPQVSTLAGRFLPIATTSFATLFSLQPIHLPGYAVLTPAFALMAVYHWTIYRPDLLPPSALFAIGVIHDLLSGAPPGMTPLLFLLSRAAVLRCRRWFYDRTFPSVWAGFALLTGGAMLGLWAVNSVLDWRILQCEGSIFRAALTISLFPISSFLLGWMQRALMGAG